jgi:DNA replication protein DnaC
MKATLNYNQSVIFNAIFNSDMTMKKDCPREIAFWGGYGSGKSWVSILIAYYL